MRKEVIYTLKSLYRDDMRITAYTFGEGEKTVCIVGSMRGNEVQQMYVASLMVDALKQLEKENKIKKGKSITVIPSVNPYSLNIKERFWPVDNTDINRMFPGYDRGETTQRIADGLFSFIKNYQYGIHLASYYQKGSFVPHVRMLNTGYQDTKDAFLFEMPYVIEKQAHPIDTGTLNYNWQIWDCHAFSLYTNETKNISKDAAKVGTDAMFRFLKAMDIVDTDVKNGWQSELITDEMICPVNNIEAGIYERFATIDDVVKKGDVLARIMHPYEGYVLEEVKAPIEGRILFTYRAQLVNGHEHLFDLVKKCD